MLNFKSFNRLTSAMTSLVTIATLSVTTANAYIPIAIQTPTKNSIAQYRLPQSVTDSLDRCSRLGCAAGRTSVDVNMMRQAWESRQKMQQQQQQQQEPSRGKGSHTIRTGGGYYNPYRR